ncbi:hypothetical protein [Hydrogenophaga sp.]|uniref:hypothetical protein n=1 Tax=Hydrogenophaga sp. TaxID=1904254 RepID=UPI00262EBB75|nr:hypothetical protein [Hydrogenophaga sp.]MCW5655726.1 hypothetical protein [Hydrogenophaga sp.]
MTFLFATIRLQIAPTGAHAAPINMAGKNPNNPALVTIRSSTFSESCRVGLKLISEYKDIENISAAMLKDRDFNRDEFSSISIRYSGWFINHLAYIRAMNMLFRNHSSMQIRFEMGSSASQKKIMFQMDGGLCMY